LVPWEPSFELPTAEPDPAEPEADVVREDVGTDEEVVVVLKGFVSSLGHGWPGSSMKLDSDARSFCCCSDVVAFGLITPTIS
jgi:hypothetical protein